LTRDAPNAYVPPPAFGPFRVLHQVGVGALGPVFRTYEPTRDRLVAVKVFRLDIIPEQARTLADALSRASEAGLFHPSIVEPIASGVEGSVAYRAEEYVAAESLDVAMRHYAPAPVEKALPFVTQLAGAIDFARAAGIGHGALHPRDIFITPDEARATGFGVVDALEQSGIRAPVRRPYSAPERIDGQPWGVAADVFALAAITFELLTGRQPAGPGREAGSLPDSPHRATLERVLARAMDRDPARRYATALAFAAALEAAWRGEELEQPAPSPASATASPSAPAPAPASPSAPAHAHAPAPASPSAPAHAHAPGEFAVEEQLDPVAAALNDAATRLHREAPTSSGEIEPTLFDRAHDSADVEIPPRHLGSLEDEATLALHAPDRAPERFTDAFVKEQEALGEDRPPLEAEVETVPVHDRDTPGLGLSERAPAFDTIDEEPRGHGFASYVAVAVFGLILGFGAAYFMWGRNSTPAAPSAVATNAAPSPTTESPATPVPDASAVGPLPPPANSSPAPTSPAPERAAAPVSPPAEPVLSRNSAAGRASAPVVATRGQITVRSTPSHAGVTVNGTWRGRTPLALDSVPFGNYVVRVGPPDYKPAREEFALNVQNPSRTLNVRLESQKAAAAPAPSRASRPAAAASPVTFTGTLFVDSHPQGATVVIDGKPAGKTPLRLSDVRIGTHVVRLELARHRPWYSTARVVAGEEVRVAGSLEDIQ
jgi:serine/threonine protein kinase